MSKHSLKLLVLALSAAFAASFMSSATAATGQQGKNHPPQASGSGQGGSGHGGSAQGGSGHGGSGNGGSAHGGSGHGGPGKVTVKTGVITVKNSGAGPLTITAPPTVTRISGRGTFAIVKPAKGTPCDKSLVVPHKGGECTIGVQYTPLGEGRSTARVTLQDTGAATPSQDIVIKAD